MKKFVIASIVLCLLAVAGVATYFLLPKRTTEAELVIDAKALTVEVGKAQAVEHSCSIKEAVITYEIANESIAFVRASGSGVEIVGVLVGETDLTLSGKHKDQTFEKTVKVLVVAASDENENNGGNDGETSNPNEEGENQEGNNEGGDNTNNSPNDGNSESGNEPVVVPEISFPAENLINCRVEGNVIEISCNSNAAFAISSNIDLTKDVIFEIEMQGLTITKDLLVGNNAYKITASAVGEFEITIILEEKYEFTYIVRVVE